jgi:hypothetical protein
LVQVAFAEASEGGGAGAALADACGAATPLVAAVCDQAGPDAHSETALAKINPAAIRMSFPLKLCQCPALRFFKPPWPFATRDHHSLVGSEPPRQRHLSTAADLSVEPVNGRGIGTWIW